MTDRETPQEPPLSSTALPPVAGNSPVVLQLPVDVRSASLVILATVASVFLLRWASVVFIPVLVGLLGSYALSPVVDWLQQRRIPRAVSAALLILGVLAGIGATGYSLSDDASRLVESLPAAAQKLRDAVRALPGTPDNTLASVQKAAAQLEQAAEESNRPTPTARGVQRVQIEKPKFDIKDHLWTGSMGLMTMLGQLGMMALIAFFLMASGDRFRRKMVKLAGPTLSRKKVTLQALNQIHDQIQRYMLVQLFTSVLVGLATWLSFLALGLENAAVWGIAAGVLDLVPSLMSWLMASTRCQSSGCTISEGFTSRIIAVGGEDGQIITRSQLVHAFAQPLAAGVVVAVAVPLQRLHEARGFELQPHAAHRQLFAGLHGHARVHGGQPPGAHHQARQQREAVGQHFHAAAFAVRAVEPGVEEGLAVGLEDDVAQRHELLQRAAVAHQLVVAHTLDIGDVLDARARPRDRRCDRGGHGGDGSDG